MHRTRLLRRMAEIFLAAYFFCAGGFILNTIFTLLWPNRNTLLMERGFNPVMTTYHSTHNAFLTRKTRLANLLLFGATALGASALSVLAQEAGGPPPPPPQRPAPPSPLLEMFDANHDGVLSSQETLDALTAVLKLEKKQDGPGDFRNPRRPFARHAEEDRPDFGRRGPRPEGPGEARRAPDGERPSRDWDGPAGPQRRGEMHPPHGLNREEDARPGGPGGPGGERREGRPDRRGPWNEDRAPQGPGSAPADDRQEMRPPPPAGEGEFQGGPRGPRSARGPGGPRRPAPLLQALDANHDRVISAEEMANAPAALKALDKNSDGQLTRDELRPAPPAPRPQP
jgi:hypothetical protein